MTSSPLAKLLLPKFSVSEMLCIIDQMKVFLPIFEGKVDVSREKNEEAWQEVTRVVNLIFGGGRTPREIRLKYEEMQAQCMANYPRHLLHMRDTNGGYPQDIKEITIMEVEEALLEFLSPSRTTGLPIRNNLPSEEPQPSISAASADVGYFASLSLDDKDELIPVRPVSPASIAAASPLPSPSPSVSSSHSWADSEPRTSESGLGEELQLLPQLLRVNEQIRDEMVKLVKVSQDSARALEATAMAVQEMVQQQRDIMANMALQWDKY